MLDLPPDSWWAVPDSQLRAVAPDPGQYPDIQGIEGVSAVMDDWSGGVFDSKRQRLIVWGGGHGGYHGNELYAFDVNELSWSRLNEPTPNPNLCQQVNPDGTPNARHTYNGLAYLTHTDQLFASGGALSCGAGGCGDNLTWVFDFTALTWTDKNPRGAQRTTQCGDIAVYDPATKKVWYFDNNYWDDATWGMYSYDVDANNWTKHNSDIRYNRTAVVDPTRNLLVVVGEGEVFAYDIGNGNYTGEAWTTTGGDELVGDLAIGLAYDSLRDRYVGWKGGAVHSLDPDAKQWTQSSPPGVPPSDVPGVTNGVYGRWQYVACVDAFIVVTSVDESVYFYKPPAP